jgi:hypothetical protein
VVALKIAAEYPIEHVTLYSEAENPGGNRERYILAPEAQVYELHTLVSKDPINWTPSTRYTFIFIEKIPYPMIEDFRVTYADYYQARVETEEEAISWMCTYLEYHQYNVSIYYETKNIIVYLIERPVS